jgi:hypothetical protein
MRHTVVSVLSGVVFGLAVAGGVVMTTPASARSGFDSTYGYERTWNAALRLVRVDLGLKVTEKDEANGYLMFDYRSPENRNPTPGSMELIRSKDPGEPVRVIVQLPAMPRYHEQLMVEALGKKLRQDYGEPPTLHPTPKVEPADAGEESN